ncbi:MAG TPA: permease-like cell division protein FtsX [Thermoanaerobaculia bacterium]|nr:permease-like cell division protein FtsX [Thermoanaerobaculia bacterium]
MSSRTSGERSSLLASFGYFFREASRRIWVARRTSSVAIAMIALALTILGAFLLVSENLTAAIDRWQGKSKVTIYFTPEASPAGIDAVRTALNNDTALQNHTFVSREEAMVRFREGFSGLSSVIDDLDENPFPPSFEVEVTSESVQQSEFNRQMGIIRAMPEVEEVQFDWLWVAKLRRLVRMINTAGMIIGGILALAAAFMIANVIRLTMYAHREEVEIMRLVGATERTIRGPFLLEGILQGVIGGALAVLLLYVAYEGARYFVTQQGVSLWTSLFLTFLPWEKSLALVAGGMTAGLIGSWLSLRETPPEPFA